MQSVPGWGEVEQLSVMEPTVRVQIGGQFYDPLSWSVDSEIDGSLPANVVGGAGITTATATLTFPPLSDDGVPLSPWEGRLWPPSRGHFVRIWAGADGAEGIVFTGVVSDISGGTDSDLTVECRDNIDRLKRKVSFEPAMSYGPRLDLTHDRNIIYTGLLSTHYVGRAAALCGYYTLPPRASDNAIFHADLNGALIPTRGYVTRSARHEEHNLPLWAPAPWGSGTYNLLSRITPAGGPKRVSASRPLHISCIKGRAAIDTTASSSIGCHWEDFEVRLTVAGGYNACFVTLLSKSTGVIWRSENVTLGFDETVVAEFTTGGECTIRTSAGRSWSGQLSWNDAMSSTDMSEVVVSVHSGGPQIGAAQVWMGTEWTPIDFERSFEMDTSVNTGSLRGMGAISETAYDLIQEVAAAELSALWIDPTGKLILRNRRNMVEAAPVATKTSLNDVLSYGWQIADGGMRRMVAVKGSQVHMEMNGLPQITVWQGSGDTIDAGVMQETMVEPPDDEAWLAVHEDLWSPEQGNDFAGYPSSFNLGRYSWSIATYTDPEQGGNYKTPNQRMEKIGPQQWLIRSSPTHDVTLKVPETAQNYPLVAEHWRGESTPLIRAKGRIKFSELVGESTIVGPAWAEDYEHQAGRWVQTVENAVILADFLSRWTSQRLVTVTDVQLRPDPQIERGDIILLTDTDHYGRQLRVLVTGVHHQGKPGEWGMSIEAQLIVESPQKVTYGDQIEAWFGASYADETAQWRTASENNYGRQSRSATWRVD